jgi:kynurenine formamidase
MGKAVRLDLRQCTKDNTAVTVDNVRIVVDTHKIDLTGKIAVLQTGWAEKVFFLPSFYRNNPFLAEETSRWLVGQGVKAVALDHPVDAPLSPGVSPTPGDCPNHRCFLGNGIPLIENLINLETFDDLEFEMMAMPLKIFHCDGAPARVIAITRD